MDLQELYKIREILDNVIKQQETWNFDEQTIEDVARRLSIQEKKQADCDKRMAVHSDTLAEHDAQLIELQKKLDDRHSGDSSYNNIIDYLLNLGDRVTELEEGDKKDEQTIEDDDKEIAKLAKKSDDLQKDLDKPKRKKAPHEMTNEELDEWLQTAPQEEIDAYLDIR